MISGRTLSGAPLDDVRGMVGLAFQLQEGQLDRMLCGKPVAVSRSATPDVAEKLVARLRALDLEAYVESPPAASGTPVPPATPVVAREPREAKPAVEPVAPPPTAAAQPDELFALARPTVASPDVLPQGPALQGAEAEVLCPKCGEAQPKRTLCRKCGLDMPRYAAAQEALEREAREQRAAEVAARTQSPTRGRRPADEATAGVLGVGFSGRLGRLDYFTSSLVSTLLWLVFVLLAAKTGKAAFAGFGMFLSAIYGVRCIALRLHDTGRNGWLSLILLVPVLGGLMALALLFIGGDHDDNEYGPVPADGGGRRALVALAAVLALGTLSYRNLAGDPENAARFLAAMSAGEDGAAHAGDTGGTEAFSQANYASNNRIDIYVITGCTDCDDMREWLDGNGLRYTMYAVDKDQAAAERLHSIVAGNGDARIQLPVLEVNGKVLPGNPDVDAVHRQLRQE
ncbi:MAG: hypothetical protein AzoDbin1_02296 [Azoarcus sp.]|uniref:Uncharacterized membrane protein YhaH, DUF805 family n=2 Tax=Aromatoleum tolulyticum TaxID=34027 RepID=A0A1N6W0R9_9RHOO|nr:hypothetical protein [Azoarcus sp.]SIQ83605.1 Uncharacterized membrane protein YhaH, DUF805 family [Aromatoleum tolulyticum]